jgi:hypothetical protein
LVQYTGATFQHHRMGNRATANRAGIELVLCSGHSIAEALEDQISCQAYDEVSCCACSSGCGVAVCTRHSLHEAKHCVEHMYVFLVRFAMETGAASWPVPWPAKQHLLPHPRMAPLKGLECSRQCRAVPLRLWPLRSWAPLRLWATRPYSQTNAAPVPQNAELSGPCSLRSMQSEVNSKGYQGHSRRLTLAC